VDGQIQPLGQFQGAAHMVQVGVGEQQLVQLDAGLLHRGQQPVHVAARVHQGGQAGGLAPDQGAVLLERA
jgi:hypothetical protein